MQISPHCFGELCRDNLEQPIKIARSSLSSTRIEPKNPPRNFIMTNLTTVLAFERTNVDKFVIVFGAFIFVIGTVGNFLTLIVICNYKSMKISSRILFFLLACNDQCVLVLAETRYWLLAFSGRDIRDESIAACRAHTFFTIVFINFSTWTLCIISLERLCLTLLPLQKHPFSQIRYIGYLMTIIFTFIVIKNIFLLTREYSDGKCGSLKVGNTLIASAMDYILGYGVPFAGILIATIILVWNTFCRQHRVSDVGSMTSVKIHLRTTTVMLVTIVLIQLVIGTPGYIFSVLKDGNIFDGSDQHYLNDIYVISLTFTVTNNAINFYAYILSARGFRRAFLRLFKLGKKPAPATQCLPVAQLQCS